MISVRGLMSDIFLEESSKSVLIKKRWCAKDNYWILTCHICQIEASLSRSQLTIHSIFTNIQLLKIFFPCGFRTALQTLKKKLVQICVWKCYKNSNMELKNPYTTVLQVTKIGYIWMSIKVKNDSLFECIQMNKNLRKFFVQEVLSGKWLLVSSALQDIPQQLM